MIALRPKEQMIVEWREFLNIGEFFEVIDDLFLNLQFKAVHCLTVFVLYLL